MTMSILSRLFGGSAPPAPMLALTDARDGDFGDCVFEANWRGRTARPRAVYRGATVGFDFEWPHEWTKVTLEADTPFSAFQASFALESCGVESNRWIDALARLYGLAGDHHRMARRVPCVAITLQGDPRHSLDRDIGMKLFFFENDEHRYAEAYLNVAGGGKRIEFHEKDHEYRSNVIAALTGAQPK